MTETNRTVVRAVAACIDDFIAGRITVAEVQECLQGSLTLLERPSKAIEQAIRLAEADIEEIQFTMLLDEQRPTAIFRLDSLKAAIEAELGDEEGSSM